MKTERDLLFAEPLAQPSQFTFDEKVAAVFPDMIKRSVPGYNSVIAMTGVVAGEYVKPGDTCYDLGCSLGESTFAMASQIQQPDCQIIAIDNSAQMLDRCQQALDKLKPTAQIDLLCHDILQVDFQPCSMVVLNYTLQFIALDQRDALIQRIYAALRPGGVLLLSEKIQFSDQQLNHRMIELHHAFKRANGYSDLEISQKRTALENVLQPEYPQTHLQRLTRAGFNEVDTWFQCFNFSSMIAIKG